MITPASKSDFTNIIAQPVEAPQAVFPPSRSWQRWLIGKPLSTADAPHQTIGRVVGLAVFASDALSSTAYATQEILVVLAAAGTGAFGYAFPISMAIVVLLTIVTISYQQTIRAYPGGGGAYIVARDNLGELPAQTAGAALLTDYTLTVAVSISSGVAQLSSAYPALYPYRVFIAVGMVLFIMLINLRGVKESGFTFAIPTYFFLSMMVFTLLVGFFKYITGNLGALVDPPPLLLTHTVEAVSLFLILHAFSSGTTALTGVEAISNGITAFKAPSSRNAGIVLIWMSVILGVLFLGITFLSRVIGVVPSEAETVISQFTRTIFAGRGSLYILTITSTTVILIMAANTAFADFPRLSALAAGDGFLPRQLTFRGSRLVYSRGIVLLAMIASLLIILFKASVTALIPLYAIGVFLSFTLSQSGMARRWIKSGQLKPGEEIQELGSILHYDKSWKIKLLVNSLGAVVTAVVMMVFAITKFRDGAWIVLVSTPILVTGFFSIHNHYKKLAKQLSLSNGHQIDQRRLKRHRVIMPIAGVHQGTIQALNYARSLSSDVTVVHVSIDQADSEKVRNKWENWGDGVRLVILDSPFRLLMEPLLEFIEMVISNRQPGEMITIVVPQFVPKKRWHNLLHTQTAFWLRLALLFKSGVVITEVPYLVE
jgi:amino acid transporter